MVKTKIIRTSRGLRKVRVLANGQYRFMKMGRKPKRRANYSRRKKPTRRKRKNNYYGGLF